jgi:hypothetical protein
MKPALPSLGSAPRRLGGDIELGHRLPVQADAAPVVDQAARLARGHPEPVEAEQERRRQHELRLQPVPASLIGYRSSDTEIGAFAANPSRSHHVDVACALEGAHPLGAGSRSRRGSRGGEVDAEVDAQRPTLRQLPLELALGRTSTALRVNSLTAPPRRPISRQRRRVSRASEPPGPSSRCPRPG